MSKSTANKWISVVDRFRERYQCYASNPDVLSELIALRLPPKTDLAVRDHVWNCERCRSEYLKLKRFKKKSAANCVRNAISAGFHTEKEIAIATTLSPEEVSETLASLLVWTENISTEMVNNVRMYFINDKASETVNREIVSPARKGAQIAPSRANRKNSIDREKSKSRSGT